MRNPRSVALIGALTLTAAPVAAQPRRGPVRQGCAVAQHTLAQTDPAAPDAPPPTLAFVNETAVLAWRDHEALRVAAFDASWRLLGASREVARPAGDFAAATVGNGVALVYVERGRDVVLARINARGDAQNVPRLIARAEAPVDEVAITRTESGSFVAWVEAETHTARGLSIDARGVPRGPSVELGTGRSPRLSWLRAAGSVALTLDGVTRADEPSLLGISATSEVNTRLRWPADTAGPFELSGALYALQPHASGAPTMVRVSSGAPLGAADPMVRTRYTLLAAAVDGAAAVALLYDAGDARMLVARVGEDAAESTTAVVRSGAPVPATLALRGDGVAFVARREPAAHGAARLVVSQITCAHENP